ncbi:MAG: BatD family protein, partial [Phycisphaerales bacterium]
MQPMRTIAILAAFMLACIARAGDVRFVPPAAETWEGIPVRILVEVSNASEVQAPLGPKVDGAQVRVVERGRQSRTEVRNGRVSSSTTVTWAVEVTPDAPGTLSIPPISVT